MPPALVNSIRWELLRLEDGYFFRLDSAPQWQRAFSAATTTKNSTFTCRQDAETNAILSLDRVKEIVWTFPVLATSLVSW